MEFTIKEIRNFTQFLDIHIQYLAEKQKLS